MCGINGYNWSNPNLINDMNKKIVHRGPDGQGIFVDDLVSLGHVRLSIIDLSDAGKQPMSYVKDDKNLEIVFNGEIYNYLEIRDELIEKGYKFFSESDTEVIMAAYLEWGFECVNKFNGMWAFCIYDVSKKILFLSRDRLGVKPLYYYNNNGKFIFSSEIKGILEHNYLNLNSKKNVNSDAVDFYFSMGFIPSPYSIFKNIFKLEASYNLIYDLNKNKILKKYRYYDLPIYKPILNKDFLIGEIKKLFNDGIKLRLRSDVPVGVFLSGGIDSASVAIKMKKILRDNIFFTFSIGFRDKLDETPYINVVQEKIKSIHKHKYFLLDDFDKLLSKYFYIYDEPFADYSGFPTYMVSELAKKNGIKVVMSGDGGDEVFGGYPIHKLGKKFDYIWKMPLFLRKSFFKILALKTFNTGSIFYNLKGGFKLSLDNKENFYSNSLAEDRLKTQIYNQWTSKNLKIALNKCGNNLCEGFRIFDTLYHTLPDRILTKVDRASMANGVEVRSPYLDYRFYELSQRIPSEYKVSFLDFKIILKETLKGLVPKEILNKGKQGFSPPIEKWIFERSDLDNLKKALGKLFTDGLVSKEIYNIYMSKYFKSRNDIYDEYIVRLFIFVNWVKKWVIN
ncbi:MAG: asparagine synthase (glutamine-hydrolyzing) [Nanoarchaeota archaeon]|nr:asparagine synthase (glutamine-hydrolyzing) [Nanoarchaeota archaeon]